MIDIPVGKALVAVEDDGTSRLCKDCVMYEPTCQAKFLCLSQKRKDHKDVIFKLVDYPPKQDAEAEKFGEPLRWELKRLGNVQSWLECPVCETISKAGTTNYCPSCGTRLLGLEEFE